MSGVLLPEEKCTTGLKSLEQRGGSSPDCAGERQVPGVDRQWGDRLGSRFTMKAHSLAGMQNLKERDLRIIPGVGLSSWEATSLAHEAGQQGRAK